MENSKSSQTKLSVIDLFSGIGGFSLGLEATGCFKTIRFVEIEKFCQRVLKKHWPNVPCSEDITTAQFYEGEADVICGGFPCQDISVAGGGSGITGKRSGLWREFLRAVRLVRPKFAILENVAAILGRGLGVVLGDLAASGYDAEWDCIPAQAVGAPHERDRWWCIAYPTQVFKHDSGLEPVKSGSQIPELRNNNSEAILSEEKQTAYAGKERVQRFFPQTVCGVGAFSWCENVRGIEDFRGRSDLPEPIFRGASDGIPDWMDRIGACGNSVIPAIPELLGNAIIAAGAQ